MFTGTVVDGKIVVEGESLPEGARVTVLADEEDDGTFEVTPAEEEALLTAIRESERGHYVTVDEVLAEIRRTI